MTCPNCGDHGIRGGSFCDCVKGAEARLHNACPICDRPTIIVNNPTATFPNIYLVHECMSEEEDRT